MPPPSSHVPRPPPAKVELLSPAGSFEAFVAAVENGADAIYLGGSHFNARRFAANFPDDELRRAIDHAHVRGVKVYVTLNTLIFNEEFDGVVRFLRNLHDWGADACIVQDLGVMHAMRTLVPDLPVHISTQATVHNSAGIRFLEDLGAERVIVARENSLKDIQDMKTKTSAEIEHFVHGAMCYCYSGQCLMSSLIGGRSGNRGACASTCRLPYTMQTGTPVDLKVDGVPVAARPTSYRPMGNVIEKHVISARDLNNLERVPELIESGITSFKIEGRMKRPEYVAIVTRAYRNAIDRYYAGKFYVTEDEKEAVRKIFNREFTPGYLDGKEKWAFTFWDDPGNKGVRVGTVVASGRGWVKVSLEDSLRVKDGIEIQHVRPEGAREEYGFIVNQMLVDDRFITEGRKGEVVEIRGRQYCKKGDPVFKTSDFEVLDAAHKSYQGRIQRKVPVEVHVKVGLGQPLTVKLVDPARGIEALHVSDFVVPEARSAALTEEQLRAQLEKLGDTPFDAVAWKVSLDRNAFAPISALNEARRSACMLLERNIASRHHRRGGNDFEARAKGVLASARASNAEQGEAPLGLAVNCWGLPNLKAALRGGAKTLYFSALHVGGLQPKWDDEALTEAVSLCRAAGASLYLSSGMIQKDWEVEALRAAARKHRDGVAGVLAGHHGAVQVALEERLPVVLDWQMNVYNSYTVNYLVGKFGRGGLVRMTASPELTLDQIRGISRHCDAPVEALAHGRHTLMVSEYCSIGHATRCQLPGGTWAPCHDQRYRLEDRLGKSFPLETDGACRMYILNSVELNMVDRLADLRRAGVEVARIETIGTDPVAVETQVRAYLQAIDGLERGRYAPAEPMKALAAACPDGFTTGHFYRGPE
ncbi:MAG: DUF3656 domain-containing U32 family peptidase [Methanobacteriota archaeon]